MDIIQLPVIKGATTPAEALRVMKAARRSAAVVADSPPKGILSSFEARRAKNQGKLTVSEAELAPMSILFDGDFFSEAYPALKLPLEELDALRTQLLRAYPGLAHKRYYPQKPATRFDTLLPPDQKYGFLGYDRGAAIVITSSEEVGEKAAGPPLDCCCANPTYPHEYRAEQKRSGQNCDSCGFLVDCD